MRNVFFHLFVFLFPLLLRSQDVYVSNNAAVSFYSGTPVEDISANSAAMNSVLNIAKREIVFIVPISSFVFDKKLMQEHFNEKYLESHLYPNTVYKGIIQNPVDFRTDGETKITSSGTLSLHGTDRQRTDSATLRIDTGIINIEGQFYIRLKDHNIKIPKLVQVNIADSVRVNFKAGYKPYKKN